MGSPRSRPTQEQGRRQTTPRGRQGGTTAHTIASRARAYTTTSRSGMVRVATRAGAGAAAGVDEVGEAGGGVIMGAAGRGTAGAGSLRKARPGRYVTPAFWTQHACVGWHSV